MKIIFFFSLLLLSASSCLAQLDSVISNWNVDHLIIENSKILVWSEDFDSLRDEKRRSFLLVHLITDTNGRTNYQVTQYTALDLELNTWNIPEVHRHPPKDNEELADPRHYTIKRDEIYDHLPTPMELAGIWNRGSYYFNLDRKYKQVFIEINKSIWKANYNESPGKSEYELFR